MTISAALLLLAPAAPVALAPDAEARWVPFTLTPANQIRFAVRIDGGVAAAILDTGVTVSAVSRSFAVAARLPVRAGPEALTISGRVAAAWSDHHAIAFGALARRDVRLAVADLPGDATGGAPVDLLIGTDITAPYALDIDYDARRFRLLPSGRLPFRGAIVPLRVGADWPFYVTEVTIGDTRLDRIVVDTGDGTGLAVSHGMAAGMPEPITTTLDYGVGGARIVGLVILPAIRSGALTIRNVEVRVEPPHGFAEATGMSGRIGAGVLNRFRVLLDPGAGRMVLAPGRDAERAPLRSTSGFLLRVQRDRLDVVHVMRGSPAEHAGWTAGEAICAVDGTAIAPDYASGDLAAWPIAAPGRVVRLTDCAGRDRPVVLRHFY